MIGRAECSAGNKEKSLYPYRMCFLQWAMPSRAGRVRELARSSRSKFKLVWHQFSSLGPSLSGKFVRFSSRHRRQVPPFNSFSSVQFTSSSGNDAIAFSQHDDSSLLPSGFTYFSNHHCLDSSWIKRLLVFTIRKVGFIVIHSSLQSRLKDATDGE